MVYTSDSLALAALEIFVHAGPDEVSADLVAVPAEIPERVLVEEVDVSTLPTDWRIYPGPEGLAVIGTDWVRAQRTAVLFVPSVLVPVERNLLLNPAHPAFRSIRVGPPEPFAFDTRMWKRRP